MKNIANLLLVIPLLLLAPRSWGSADEKEAAESNLARQAELLSSIKYFLEKPDQGRLLFLQKKVQTTLDCLRDEARGMGHTATFKAYQDQVRSFQFSYAFFKQVAVEATKPQIEEIIRINDEIMKQRGLDDMSAMQITANLMTQLHNLCVSLIAMAIPDPLKAKLHALDVELGRNVIPIAKQGDRPLGFAAATRVHEKFLALYPELMKVATSNEAFEVAMEIMGVNEVFADYAQLTLRERQ